MRKFLNILLLVPLLLLPVFSSADAKTFQDVPKSNVYFQVSNTMSELGVINGYDDNTLQPKIAIQRKHVAALIYRASENGLVDLTPIRPATKFTDVPESHKYYKEIMALYRAGIIDGVNGQFNPNGNLTRGQMSKILSNTFKLNEKITTSFNDVSLENGFNKYIGALADANITTGYEDGKFKPNASLSRIHFSVFMYRALGFEDKQVKVHFIDVGQGDSIFIQTPNGKNMLIDGGERSAGKNVVSYIKALGISTIDYVVATHPDADHIGGLIDVLDNFNVKNVWNSGKSHTSETYEDLLNAINNEDTNYIVPQIGTNVTLDQDVKVNVLYSNPNAVETNDASIVLKMTHGEVDVLLTGDAGEEVEANLTNVGAEVLKAGHHGSNTSNSLSFLQRVKPEDIILSYGKDNSYGHPHSGVLENIKAVGATAYATADNGTIVVTSDGVTHNTNALAHKEGKDSSTTSPSKSATGENNNSTTTQTTGNPSSGTYVVPGAPTSFPNCTSMREYYPNGVKSTHPAYESKHDRDHDSWACEKS